MTANNPVEGYENLADRNSQPLSANGANPKTIMDFTSRESESRSMFSIFRGHEKDDTNSNKCTTMARSFKITIHLYVLIPPNIWVTHIKLLLLYLYVLTPANIWVS